MNSYKIVRADTVVVQPVSPARKTAVIASLILGNFMVIMLLALVFFMF